MPRGKQEIGPEFYLGRTYKVTEHPIVNEVDMGDGQKKQYHSRYTTVKAFRVDVRKRAI